MNRGSGGRNGGKSAASLKVGKDSGRVKVYVRVRPFNKNENIKSETSALNVCQERSQVTLCDSKYGQEKNYQFDHVFPQTASNFEVCRTVSRPLITAALNGFNGTLMAYGQTGAGKTHTLMAPDGITTTVINNCFKRMVKDEAHQYKVSLSYLQIYQEKIYDLLNSNNRIELSLREHPLKGIYVENLGEYVVRSPCEVSELLALGRKRLVFAETKMNRQSSRSHSVCMLVIERTLNQDKDKKEKDILRSPSKTVSGEKSITISRSPTKKLVKDVPVVFEEEEEDVKSSISKVAAYGEDVLLRGKIYICDLAGSERLKKTQAEGERLSEAQHINSSLLELGNVIQALAEGRKTHVPFRNSTLTRLLQESLGGNCKTSLMVCVSPASCHVSETKCSLNFGFRAMKVTNTAYVNLEVDFKRLSDDLAKLINQKDVEFQRLKEEHTKQLEEVRTIVGLEFVDSLNKKNEEKQFLEDSFNEKENILNEEIGQLKKQLLQEKESRQNAEERIKALEEFIINKDTHWSEMEEMFEQQRTFLEKKLENKSKRDAIDAEMQTEEIIDDLEKIKNDLNRSNYQTHATQTEYNHVEETSAGGEPRRKCLLQCVSATELMTSQILEIVGDNKLKIKYRLNEDKDIVLLPKKINHEINSTLEMLNNFIDRNRDCWKEWVDVDKIDSLPVNDEESNGSDSCSDNRADRIGGCDNPIRESASSMIVNELPLLLNITSTETEDANTKIINQESQSENNMSTVCIPDVVNQMRDLQTKFLNMQLGMNRITDLDNKDQATRLNKKNCEIDLGNLELVDSLCGCLINKYLNICIAMLETALFPRRNTSEENINCNIEPVQTIKEEPKDKEVNLTLANSSLTSSSSSEMSTLISSETFSPGDHQMDEHCASLKKGRLKLDKLLGDLRNRISTLEDKCTSGDDGQEVIGDIGNIKESEGLIVEEYKSLFSENSTLKKELLEMKGRYAYVITELKNLKDKRIAITPRKGRCCENETNGICVTGTDKEICDHEVLFENEIKLEQDDKLNEILELINELGNEMEKSSSIPERLPENVDENDLVFSLKESEVKFKKTDKISAIKICNDQAIKAIKKAQRERGLVGGEIAKLKTKFTELVNELDETCRSKKDLENKHDKLLFNESARNDEVQTLQVKYNHVEEKLLSCAKEKGNLQADHDLLQYSFLQIKEEAEILRSCRKDLEEKLVMAKEEFLQLQTCLQNQDSLSSLEERSGYPSLNEIKELDEGNKRLGKEIGLIKTSARKLSKELEMFKGYNMELEEQMKQGKIKMNELQKSSKGALAEKELLKEQLDSARQTQAVLEMTLNEERKKNERYNPELESGKKQNNVLLGGMDTKHEKLASLSESCAEANHEKMDETILRDTDIRCHSVDDKDKSTDIQQDVCKVETKKSKLRSELNLAKEDLTRLKAELAFSSIHSKDIHQGLTVIKQESEKLEYELVTLNKETRLEKRNRMESLMAENTKLEGELAEVLNTCKVLEDENERLLNENTDCKEKVEEFQKDLRKSMKNLENLTLEKDTFLSEIKLLKKQFDILNEEKRILEIKLQDYVHQASVSFVLDNQKGEELKIKDLKRQVIAVMRENAEMGKKLQDYSDEEMWVKDIERVAAEMLEVDEDIKNIRKKMKGSLPPHENAYESDKFQGFNEIQSLKDETQVLKEHVNALTQYSQTLEMELEESKRKMLVQEISSGKEEKKALATLLAHLKIERSKLESKVESLASENDKLTVSLDEAQDKLNSTTSELGIALERVQMLEKQLNGFQNAKIRLMDWYKHGRRHSEESVKINKLYQQNISSSLENIKTLRKHEDKDDSEGNKTTGNHKIRLQKSNDTVLQSGYFSCPDLARNALISPRYTKRYVPERDQDYCVIKEANEALQDELKVVKKEKEKILNGMKMVFKQLGVDYVNQDDLHAAFQLHKAHDVIQEVSTNATDCKALNEYEPQQNRPGNKELMISSQAVDQGCIEDSNDNEDDVMNEDGSEEVLVKQSSWSWMGIFSRQKARAANYPKITEIKQ